ncbi:hypothetical protein FCN77_25700 [Arthrobacter sp. 24S4-2]|nr:hypothetical protein FCN77_25700 [Arthrobacter sp. 24S4-2]
MGPGLAENLAAQGVREERLYVGRVGGNHKVKEVGRGCVVGNQVGGGIADAEIQDLHIPGPLSGGNLARALGYLFCVVGAGHEDAHRAVEDLVNAIQHQIMVV